MKVALLADIHANLHALDAVESALREMDVDLALCLGDVVGYGAFPSECIAAVQARCEVTVKGNHDHYVTRTVPSDRFNRLAYHALSWTADQLDESERQWLAELPLLADHSGLRLCHANPLTPEAWVYVLDRHDADLIFRSTMAAITVVGHSHVMGCFVEDEGPVPFSDGTCLDLAGRRAVINPGSVGQPRDGDPRGAFAIWDVEKQEIRAHRVTYDVEAARSAILDAGLPEELGDRLRVGH